MNIMFTVFVFFLESFRWWISLLKSRELKKWIFVLKLFVNCNHYCFYNFILKRELVYVFHMLFIVD